ncbi:unnamed protein product [Closterium sp. NIES-54]
MDQSPHLAGVHSTATPSASAASAASATTAASAASSTATTSATSAPTATAATASASTAATDTSTPTSTPTATPTPPAASTSTSTAPARSSSAPAPFALARAASPARGRRSTDRLKPKESDSLTERHEPGSCPASPVRAVRTGRRVLRPRPSPILGTHIMALRPSSNPLRVPLPPPPASSLPAIPDPQSDLAHPASPTVPRLLATVVTDPSFESTAASAVVAELVDFAAACRLDYATSLVAESESDCPPSVKGESALGMDVLEGRQEDFECLAAAIPHIVAMLLAHEGDLDAPDIPTPRSYAEAITGPYSSQWQITMDAEMAS